jgi:hypothetical protein
MSIDSITSVNPLFTQLQTQGLSASQAQLVAADVTSVTGGASAGSIPAPITTSMRAAINTKLASDVLAGKLSESDAAAVQKTLDGLGSQADGSTTDASNPTDTTTTAPATDTKGTGKAHHGGGGGKSKTEVSEDVTIDGSVETTVITYSDNTTSTTTSTVDAADTPPTSNPVSARDAQAATKDYTQSIAPGLIVDSLA